MKKILFFIHDLGPGGAEKVLVNLVNNMDPEQFDITVMTLVGGGVNEQFLKPHVRHVSCFKRLIRGHTHLLKLLSPPSAPRLVHQGKVRYRGCVFGGNLHTDYQRLPRCR